MTGKRTAVLNIAIKLAKITDYATKMTQLAETMAYELKDLDDELKKPQLKIIEKE